MKRNALIRIILYSVLILVLATPLFSLIRPERSQNTTTEVSVSMTPSNTVPSDVSSRHFPAEDIHSLDIDWAAGSITLALSEDEFIYISESGDPTNPMDCKIEERELSIEFSDRELGLVRFDKDKTLLISVPKDWFCRSLEVDAASALLQIHDLTFGEVDIDTASGEVHLTNCTTNSLDVDTASGNVAFSGSLNRLECDAASANVTAVLDNTPKTIKVDSASGCLDLTLPEETGFTVDLTGLSTNLNSEFAAQLQEGLWVYGDGRCWIVMNSMSGEVFLRSPK